MSWTDAAGVVGVVLILAAYAAGILGKLHPQRAASLLANFVGASLILLSLSVDFNLPAALIEAAWAATALFGLVRLAVVRRRSADPRR
ncbi:MAG: CBU_0592 family membrane protein [Pseudomonadota bacterium]